MEFISAALKTIPQAASHPFALIAYLCVVVSWAIIAFRVQRNSELLKQIEKLPPKDRLIALQSEMGATIVKDGISPVEWLASKRQSYYFWGFVAVIAAVIIVFVIAINQSRSEKSRDELVGILADRGKIILSSVDMLIEGLPGSKSAIFDGKADEYNKTFKEALVRLRSDVDELINKMLTSLKNGELVRAHELGNEIHGLASRLEPLMLQSSERVDSLKSLVAKLSMMNPMAMSRAEVSLAEERKRIVLLEKLSSGLKAMCGAKSVC